MNVLVLAPQPYYIDRGTPIDVDLLLRALSARGEEVDAVVYHEGRDREHPKVTVHRIRAPRWLKGLGPGFSVKKLMADVLLFLLAWRLVRTRQYDVVHAGEEAAFMAMFFKAAYGIPYVYDMDSSIAQQLVEKMPCLRSLQPLFNALERSAIRHSAAAAPVCHALAELAQMRGAPFIETLHDISQLSVPDREASGELKDELGIDGLALMYVGNLEAYQGIDLLLDAFRIVRQRGVDLDLIIAGGSDPDIARYRSQAADLGIDDRCHFIGAWPAERLDELLAEADILTAPRIKGINTPMKIFPYLHTGRPLLVTDLPTHTQVLDDSCAMLAPPEPAGFANAIERLAADRALRDSLGARGRAFVEGNHTFQAHQRRVDRLYDYLAATCDAASRGLAT